MSDGGSPEFHALAELERVLAHLTEGLAEWRRRALKAEAERTELGSAHDAVAGRERLLELEADNAELHQRLEAARRRVADLLARLRFLEEQVVLEGESR